MIVTLEISQDILVSARLSPEQAKVELAIFLYAQGLLSAGKAREPAGMSLWQLRQLLASRQIPVHYTVEALEDEVATL